MNDSDVLYHGDEEPPPIKACLMHPERQPSDTFNKAESEFVAGTSYGLCEECLDRLDTVPGYQGLIDHEIETRNAQLIKERMN